MAELHYENLAEAMRDAIQLMNIRPDCCILAARATLDALNTLGVTGGFALSVRADCFNPKLARMVFEATERHGGDMAAANRDLASLTQEMVADGCWSVVIGSKIISPDKLTGWDGHLVAAVLEDTHLYLIDPTLGVASRPAKNLHMKAFAGRVPVEWMKGDLSAHWHFPDGATVIYRARPTDSSYQFATDWKDKDEKIRARRKQLMELAVEIYKRMPPPPPS